MAQDDGQHGVDMADGRTTPESLDRLKRVLVRLLEIAGRCEDDPAIQHELMQLSDELAKIIDDSEVILN